MISIGALLRALKAVIPHLPRGVQRLMSGVLAFLPLTFEIAKLLYEHREQIRDIIDNLTGQISDQVRRETQGIAETIPHLPKRVARWLRCWLAYLPLALEIAKASNRKNIERVRGLIAPLPSRVKGKIRKILRRYHRRSRWNLFRRFQR